MQIARRRLFATIAAAFVAKPAVKTLRCECPRCQYARGFLRRGGYEFYPDAFTIEAIPLINPVNRLLTPKEVAQGYLATLKRNTLES